MKLQRGGNELDVHTLDGSAARGVAAVRRSAPLGLAAPRRMVSRSGGIGRRSVDVLFGAAKHAFDEGTELRWD